MSVEDRRDAGYETLDAHAGSTLQAGIFLLGATFLVAAIVSRCTGSWLVPEAQEQPRPATVIETAPSPAAFPRLVTNEPSALARVPSQGGRDPERLRLGRERPRDRAHADREARPAHRGQARRAAFVPDSPPSPAPAAGVSNPGGTR